MIKFRAWHKEDKEMLSVVGMRWVGDDKFYCDLNSNRHGIFGVWWNQIELMQWTGLKDYKGVDIYEGDIVEIELDRCSDEKTIVEIEWCPMNCSFVVNHEDPYYYGSLIRVFRYDGAGLVIGNRFENPELVKE